MFSIFIQFFFVVVTQVATAATEDTDFENKIDEIPEEQSSLEESNEPALKNYVEPVLYSWFYKLRAHMLAKLTVYFYDTLKQPLPEKAMKDFCSRLVNDIPAK